MAKIILKSRYLQTGSKRHSEHLIKYIALREGVQKIDDTWKHKPVSKQQKKLITELTDEFPDTKNSFEYVDYLSHPNKGTASEFITRAIEDNIDLVGKRENYVEYIAKRPHAERQGEHGLFTDDNIPINLSKVAKEVANHDGNVYTHILSLRREDATRLGYDNAYAWRNLVRSQAEMIARNMKIPATDLRWYAAFHNESFHPHIHMVVYSVGKEPYLTKQGIRNIKAGFARQIFKHDLLQVYAEQTQHRNRLTQNSRDVLSDIAEQINSGGYDNPIVTDLLVKLSEQMKKHKGKKVYGYLPQAGRNIVNSIVDELSKDKNISALYDLWYQQRNAVTSTYQDECEPRVPLSQNKEFKVIKNTVIQESLNILYDRITFEDSAKATEEFTPDESVLTESMLESSVPKKQWNVPDSMYFQYRKAKEYLDKKSLLYDAEEAVRWLELSAEQGYEYAQYRLGKMFLSGEEVEQNIDYGLYHAWQAAEQENNCAEYLLGKIYLNGELTEQDIPQAETMFERASEHGSSYAKYSLAKMHLAGLAMQSDEDKAILLLRESATSGNQWAQYLLGKFCLRGKHTEKDIVEAEKLLTASAEQKNSQAGYLLAKLYLTESRTQTDAQKPLYWLQESAKLGNQYAQYQLGKMLLFGNGAEKDVESGIQLLSFSAEQGNIYAARMLENYYSGRPQKPSVGMASFRLLSHLARMFEECIRKDEDNQKIMIDKKLRQKIEEKKQLHGLKMG